MRQRSAELGRGEILIFAMFTIIVASTEAEAAEKLQEYRSYIDYEGALALMSGWTGVDLSTYDLDEELRLTKTDANQSALESFTVAEPDRHWKIREIAEFVGLGGAAPVVVGSPTRVADLLATVDRGNGCRWIQSDLCRDARDLRKYHRPVNP